MKYWAIKVMLDDKRAGSVRAIHSALHAVYTKYGFEKSGATGIYRLEIKDGVLLTLLEAVRDLGAAAGPALSHLYVFESGPINDYAATVRQGA